MIQAILFTLLISAGIGLPLTLIIAPKHNAVGRIGLSYLLGIGIFTLAMFVTNILGLKFNLLHTILIFVVLSSPLFLLSFKQVKNYCVEVCSTRKNLHLDKLEKIILIGILFLIASSFVNTLYWPVYIWDALTMYDFRSKLFISLGFVKDVVNMGYGSYYLTYPLLTSLAHTLIYLFGGSNPQFIYSLYYLSLGLVFYGELREFVSRKSSMTFTLLLLTIPQVFNQSLISYTNLPYLTYFSMGGIYLYVWSKNKNSGYLVISALLTGFSTWTRGTEPLWLALFGMVILLGIIKKKYLDILIFCIIFIPIQQMWNRYVVSFIPQSNTINGIVGNSQVILSFNNWPRFMEVFVFLYKNVIVPWGANVILFIMCFTFVVFTHKIKHIYVMYILIFCLFILVFLGAYAFSFNFPGWNEIPDSASRMAMIFYPLFIYSVGLTYDK